MSAATVLSGRERRRQSAPLSAAPASGTEGGSTELASGSSRSSS
jgi:hypothetical protein